MGDRLRYKKRQVVTISQFGRWQGFGGVRNASTSLFGPHSQSGAVRATSNNRLRRIETTRPVIP